MKKDKEMYRLLMIWLLLLGTILSANDFDKGLAAYYQGNYRIANTFFSKSCDSGEADGCNNLGVLYVTEEGVKQDYFKAKTLFTKACDSGKADGCTNLGNLYYNGLGVQQDNFKAKTLYIKACDSGSDEGCRKYAILIKGINP